MPNIVVFYTNIAHFPGNIGKYSPFRPFYTILPLFQNKCDIAQIPQFIAQIAVNIAKIVDFMPHQSLGLISSISSYVGYYGPHFRHIR